MAQKLHTLVLHCSSSLSSSSKRGASWSIKTANNGAVMMMDRMAVVKMTIALSKYCNTTGSVSENTPALICTVMKSRAAVANAAWTVALGHQDTMEYSFSLTPHCGKRNKVKKSVMLRPTKPRTTKSTPCPQAGGSAWMHQEKHREV